MFDLKEAIEVWREQASRHVPSDALEELESHLQDAVEARIEDGMKAEEAFVLATHQLGNLQHVGKEIIRESGRLPVARPRTFRVRKPWMAFALPALACVALLFVVECFRVQMMDYYGSQVTFEVHPKGTGSRVAIFNDKTIPMDKTVDMKTQLEVIRSRNTLYRVVDNLNLDEEWGVTRVAALDRLKKRLTVTQVGEAMMARIRYMGSDAQLAANIANASAAAYRDRTMLLWKSKRNNELDTLQTQLKDQSDKVEEARLRMLDLAERYRIMPETSALANESIQDTMAARRAAELNLAKGLGSENEDSLRKELLALKDVEESFKDIAMDERRKTAEYDEAKNEYELQSQMLHSMQEAYAKAQVDLTKPLVPITIHEEAEVAVSKLKVDWPGIWFGVFRNGWPWILGIGATGWWLSGFLSDRRHAAYASGALPASVTKKEDEVSWA